LALHPLTLSMSSVGVIHFIANHDPDVDALYQLLLPLPVEFPHHRQSPVLVPLTRSDRPMSTTKRRLTGAVQTETETKTKTQTNAPTPITPMVGRRHRVYSPYNAHSTLHFQSMLWSLLLPITVETRFSEVVRSYIAQRLMSDVRIPNHASSNVTGNLIIFPLLYHMFCISY
jgi:hypothetical protein